MTRPLVIVGDQAFFQDDEWDRARRRREQWRESKRRARNGERRQSGPPLRVAGLHELRCSGPHPPNLRCKPIPLYQRRYREEAG